MIYGNMPKEDPQNHQLPVCLFLSPPVHIVWWAHMHRLLSVCLSQCHWIITRIADLKYNRYESDPGKTEIFLQK